MRHGPMVLSACPVCRRSASVEDAFQATFLVLAKKAATYPDRTPWSVGCTGRPPGGLEDRSAPRLPTTGSREYSPTGRGQIR